ncbi:hypothetical protein ACFONG_19005, partial [Uliginosibacterium paludis]
HGYVAERSRKAVFGGEVSNSGAIDIFLAVLKHGNFRSAALLRKLGFALADEDSIARHRDSPDEIVMVKALGTRAPA